MMSNTLCSKHHCFFTCLLIVFGTCLLFSPLRANNVPLSTKKVQFYSTKLSFQYHPDIILKYRTCTSDRCLKKFFRKMEETPYQVLLDDLLKKKEELALNDWFFYQLVRKANEKIYHSKSEIYQTLATWFFITKAGYHTRINTANNQYVFLYVRTSEEVFYTPFIKYKEGEKFVNLTSMYYGLDTRRVIFEISGFQPVKEGKDFSFDLENLPNLPPQLAEKTLRFNYGDKEEVLQVKVDTLINALMRGYPVLEDKSYFKQPFSVTVQESLFPQLRALLVGKSQKEQAELLVSLTRHAFDYGWDYELYQRSQPMFAEQVLLSKQSDHEDRCALFFMLAKELTDLDVVVFYYYDSYHTIGVALEEKVGEAVPYNGKDYYICDPTEPSNSSKIGKIPTAFDPQTVEVIAQMER